MLGFVVEVLGAKVKHVLHLQDIPGTRVGARVQHHLCVPPHAVLDRLDDLQQQATGTTGATCF